MTPSTTYKLRPQGFDSALYFTICRNEAGRIWALFVNAREMESFEWITGLMTAYTRQLEYGVPASEVIADMKETFSPNGGYVAPKTKGTYVHSVVHHLGLVLERDQGAVDNMAVEAEDR